MTQDEVLATLHKVVAENMNYTTWTVSTPHLVALVNLAVEQEREACAELVWPKLKVWSEEEQTAMGLAFNRAQEKHGWYETLMAVGASVLKIKAEAIRARGSS